jgi:hypothetical protein
MFDFSFLKKISKNSSDNGDMSNEKELKARLKLMVYVK